MVNRGEEKVRVHMNAVPRSTMNANRETVDLIRRSWVRFPPKSKDFSLPRVVPGFPLPGLTPSGLFMSSISTLIYTSELILCFTICVHSATRHSIVKCSPGRQIDLHKLLKMASDDNIYNSFVYL